MIASLSAFVLVAATSLVLKRFSTTNSLSNKPLLLGNSMGAMKNTAFLFIKPHANTLATQALVREKLLARGLSIVDEGEFSGEQIDREKLIDQHYFAIASKATLVPAAELPVPPALFLEAFGERWEDVLAENRAFNAIDAQAELALDDEAFDTLWQSARKTKFGGGFYCARLPRTNSALQDVSDTGLQEEEEKNSIYTFNGFFMSMRRKFVARESAIHFFVVQFDAKTLSWRDFRSKLLGATDPSTAPKDSLRGEILAKWRELGLASEPTVGDNCVHGSASPFEGLAERLNWLKIDLYRDAAFGAALLAAGLSEETIRAWTRDPLVKDRSLFDQLEDLDVKECLSALVALSQ